MENKAYNYQNVNTNQIDIGLRNYMLSIYNYMASGLLITGIISYFTYMVSFNNNELTNIGSTLFTGPLSIVIIFSPLIIVLAMSFGLEKFSANTLKILFFLYSTLMGVSLATIFAVYTIGSIFNVFFITAATFGGLSLWGYTTQKDLSGFGTFLIMGLFGLIISSIVNIFIGSSALDFAISIIGVFIFAGLTAYDTQKLKDIYSENTNSETRNKIVVMGALNLYLDFINLMLYLLKIFGQKK